LLFVGCTWRHGATGGDLGIMDLGLGWQRIALCIEGSGSATGQYWPDMEFKQWNGDVCKRIPNYSDRPVWI